MSEHAFFVASSWLATAFDLLKAHANYPPYYRTRRLGWGGQLELLQDVTMARFERYKEYLLGDYCYGLGFSEGVGGANTSATSTLSASTPTR